jgi:hypothetical protein
MPAQSCLIENKYLINSFNNSQSTLTKNIPDIDTIINEFYKNLPINPTITEIKQSLKTTLIKLDTYDYLIPKGSSNRIYHLISSKISNQLPTTHSPTDSLNNNSLVIGTCTRECKRFHYIIHIPKLIGTSLFRKSTITIGRTEFESTLEYPGYYYYRWKYYPATIDIWSIGTNGIVTWKGDAYGQLGKITKSRSWSSSYTDYYWEKNEHIGIKKFHGIIYPLISLNSKVTYFIGYASQIHINQLMQPPIISDPYPKHEDTNIPLTLKHLTFKLTEPNGQLMDYRVTTYPNIGSKEEKNVPDGQYKLPITNLQPETTYHWTINLTDGENGIEETYNFTTQAYAPIAYNPIPPNEWTYTNPALKQLKISLKDLQGDPITYSIETNPHIGSVFNRTVTNGTFILPIHNLTTNTTYQWTIYLSDGINQRTTHYTFITLPENTYYFNPSDDTYIDQEYPTQNYGSSNIIRLRQERSSSDYQYILIHFNISTIPTNTQIKKAHTHLYLNDTNIYPPTGKKIFSQRIKSSWDENTVTWITRPAYHHTYTSFSILPTTVGEWMTWDVTKDIQLYVNKTITNHGWRILDPTYEVGSFFKAIYLSKENTDNIPFLIIET